MPRPYSRKYIQPIPGNRTLGNAHSRVTPMPGGGPQSSAAPNPTGSSIRRNPNPTGSSLSRPSKWTTGHYGGQIKSKGSPWTTGHYGGQIKPGHDSTEEMDGVDPELLEIADDQRPLGERGITEQPQQPRDPGFYPDFGDRRNIDPGFYPDFGDRRDIDPGFSPSVRPDRLVDPRQRATLDDRLLPDREKLPSKRETLRDMMQSQREDGQGQMKTLPFHPGEDRTGMFETMEYRPGRDDFQRKTAERRPGTVLGQMTPLSSQGSPGYSPDVYNAGSPGLEFKPDVYNANRPGPGYSFESSLTPSENMVQNAMLNVSDDLDEPPVVFDPEDPNSQIQQPSAGGGQRTRTGAELDNMSRPDFGGGVNSSLVRGGDGASPVARSEPQHMGSMVDGEFVPGAQPDPQEPRPITLLPSAQNPPVEQRPESQEPVDPRPNPTLLPSAQNPPATNTSSPNSQSADGAPQGDQRPSWATPTGSGSQSSIPGDQRPLSQIPHSELVPDGGGNLDALYSRFNKRKQEMLDAKRSGRQWTQEGSQVAAPDPDYTPPTNYRPDLITLGGGHSSDLYNKVADIQGNPRSVAYTDSEGRFHPGRGDVDATLREAERRGYPTSGGSNRRFPTSGSSASPGAQGAKKTGEYTGLPAPSSMDEWNDRSSIHQVDEDGDFVLDLDGNLIKTDFGHEVQARREANEAGINARLDDAAYRYNRQALREGREPTAKPGQYTPARMDRLNSKRAFRKLGGNAARRLERKYGKGAATEAAAMEGGIAEYTRRKANEQRGDIEAIDNRLDRDKLKSTERISKRGLRQRERESQRYFDSHAADRSSRDRHLDADRSSLDRRSDADRASLDRRSDEDRSSHDHHLDADRASEEKRQDQQLAYEREKDAQDRADAKLAKLEQDPIYQLDQQGKLDDAKFNGMNYDQQTQLMGVHIFGKDAPVGTDRSNGARTWVRSHGLSIDSTAVDVRDAAVQDYSKARSDADRLRIAKHALTMGRVLGDTNSDWYENGWFGKSITGKGRRREKVAENTFRDGSRLTNDQEILAWASKNLKS